MNARPIAVAAVQLRAHDRADFSERWPALLARVVAAAESGSRLIVVPEGTVPAYVIGRAPIDPQLLEAAAKEVIAISQRTGATIVYGGARIDEHGVANAAYVVTPAGVTGYADKFFLWHFDRRWFTPGKTLQPVDTPVGRLGVFVCADGRLPTVAAALVAAGAEVLAVPTAWVTSGRDPSALENVQADIMIPVRARENGVALVAANKVGVEARSVLYCGKSQIVAADGSLVALAGQDDETTLQATVAIGPSIAPPALAPAAIARHAGPPLGPRARIAIAAHVDPALHAAAGDEDVDLVVDPHAVPASDDVATVEDEAMVDPRALVGPRLDGVRLFVWRASIDAAWTTRFARTRAAELRCFVIVLDTLQRRAFAVDPDGALVCGTIGAFELTSFTFDRARTDGWQVAPGTDVRAGLERVRDLTTGVTR